MFCRLRKSLYGLKQAGREWNKLLDSWLTGHGSERSKADCCLHTMSEGERVLYLAVWVADIVLLAIALCWTLSMNPLVPTLVTMIEGL